MEAAQDALQKDRVHLMSLNGQEKLNDENAKLIKGVWADSYRFYLKYHGRPMGPGIWQEATSDFAEIMKKYEGSPVCGRVMLAAFSQLEEEAR